MRPHLTILALSAALASPALAASAPDDEVIATAQGKPGAQALTATAAQVASAAATTPARPLTTQDQIAAFVAANPNPEVEGAARGLLPADRDEDGKRRVHGSMGVSVGTGGYRSGYVSALIPVGESATVGVAVSKTEFGKRGGWIDPAYDGYGHGPGYGYRGGGARQSIALSVMSGARDHADVPPGCAPGFRVDGRYVEPAWVDGLRDGAHPCAAADVASR
ncbi:hypothetical protein [uncultured Caulobacter sp.]|uniref:hypothetical protein n=1 Tax=uncultured Caulobacter sp. TaxID=158749 RepID=UPI00262418A0|nr:hypothetical protein [uncultured Caulobacter sp.]